MPRADIQGFYFKTSKRIVMSHGNISILFVDSSLRRDSLALCYC